MAYTQPELPFAEDALDPHISANTLGFHYGKHHATYVKKYNDMVAGTPYDDQSIEDVIVATANDPDKAGVFNNGAQAWNHSFYWNCLSPEGGGKPSGEIVAKIESDLGGYDAFKNEFANAAATQFGSGWAWLVLDAGRLKIVKTANAQTPLANGMYPLLTIDVWEHAYYLDYQNRRPDYIAAVIDELLNWEFVSENLLKAQV